MTAKWTVFVLVAFAIAAVGTGCALLQAFRPALPAIAAALLAELDNVLDAYEEGAAAEDLSGSAVAQMEDLQTARRVLIGCLIDELAEEYPELSLQRRLERLNNATGLSPP